MDINEIDESPTHSVTSLDGLYTDFDGWVARYISCYKRTKYFTKEISTNQCQNDSRQHTEDNLEEDSFFTDLLRKLHLRRPVKTPSLNLYKEDDGFAYYDHVYYRLMNKNGDRRIVYQFVRSKL